MAYISALTSGLKVTVHGVSGSVSSGTIHMTDERGIQLITGNAVVANIFYPWTGVDHVTW